MKPLFLFITFFFCIAAYAQKPYSISKDEQTGGLVFKGPITLADLNTEPSFKWMKSGMDSYSPDATSITYLAKTLPDYDIVAIMGTWCDDSQYLIPKLARVLRDTKFPVAHFSLFGVDREKQTGGIESKVYDVKRVPTIVVLKGNKEVGRIVESVSRSIEAELAQIVQKAGQ
jgi:thiol-disulfide isomerase/thioredoxin